MIGTIGAWRAYASQRGDERPSSSSDALATQALVRASDHIDFLYLRRAIIAVPAEIAEAAAYEAANYELATPNFFSAVYTPAQQKVLTEVKGIKWTVSGENDSQDTFANVSPTSTRIAAMLAPYIEARNQYSLRSIG